MLVLPGQVLYQRSRQHQKLQLLLQRCSHGGHKEDQNCQSKLVGTSTDLFQSGKPLAAPTSCRLVVPGQVLLWCCSLQQKMLLLKCSHGGHKEDQNRWLKMVGTLPDLFRSVRSLMAQTSCWFVVPSQVLLSSSHLQLKLQLLLQKCSHGGHKEGQNRQLKMVGTLPDPFQSVQSLVAPTSFRLASLQPPELPRGLKPQTWSRKIKSWKSPKPNNPLFLRLA